MSEYISWVDPEVESNKKEAKQMAQNPFVRESLKESQTVIKKVLGSYSSVNLNFINNVEFVPIEEIHGIQFGELQKQNWIYDEIRKRRIDIKSDQVNVHYFFAEKDNGNQPKKLLLSAQPHSDFFLDSNKYKPDNLVRSQGAIYLFRVMADAAVNEVLIPSPIDVSADILQSLANSALREIPSYFKKPNISQISQVIGAIQAEMENGSSLRLEAYGAATNLQLGDKTLNRYHTEDSNLLLFTALEKAEDEFVRRISRSQINGKKWFIEPSKWPNSTYRKHKTLSRYQDLQEQFEGDPLSALLSNQVAIRLFQKDILDEVIKPIESTQTQQIDSLQELIEKYGDAQEDFELFEDVPVEIDDEDYGSNFQRLTKKKDRRLER